MSQFSTLGVSECATLFFLDSTNISAAVYSRYKRPMFNSYLEWQRCSPARWQAVWKTQSGVVHNTASKLAPWYDCASLQSAFGRSTPLSPVGTASPLSNSISLPTASLQEQAVNETSAPHLHCCPPPTTTSHYSGHSPNWRLCVCVQVRVDTPENDIEPSFLIPGLRLIGGQLSIVVAVVWDFLLGCLLQCFSAACGSSSHTPCNYCTATTPHAILTTYLSLRRK